VEDRNKFVSSKQAGIDKVKTAQQILEAKKYQNEQFAKIQKEDLDTAQQKADAEALRDVASGVSGPHPLFVGLSHPLFVGLSHPLFVGLFFLSFLKR